MYNFGFVNFAEIKKYSKNESELIFFFNNNLLQIVKILAEK